MLLALLIEGKALDIRLLSAAGVLRIGNRPCRWFEIGIAIDRRIGAIFNECASVFVLEGYRERLAHDFGWEINRGIESLCWIEDDAIGAQERRSEERQVGKEARARR